MFRQLFRYDVLAQFRQGFYLVYGVITCIYLAVLFGIPADTRRITTAILLLSDTSVLGMFFVGALVLLEKQQAVLQSLFITPMKINDYLWGKVLSLALLTLLFGSFIAFLPGGLLRGWFFSLITLLLTSMIFTLVGLGIAAKVSTLNGYLAGMMLGGVIAALPVAGYFYLNRLFLIFPINAALELMLKPPGEAKMLETIFYIVVLLSWFTAAYFFARRQFRKYRLQC